MPARRMMVLPEVGAPGRGTTELRLNGVLRSSSTARKNIFEKGTYEHSKFIGDSSGAGTNASLHTHPCTAREGQTRREVVTSKRGGSDVDYCRRSEGRCWRKDAYPTRPTTWVFPKTKWTLVVMAVAVLALLAAFAALIPASEAPTPITSTRRAVGTISRGQRLR